jgi:hypothetical protein
MKKTTTRGLVLTLAAMLVSSVMWAQASPAATATGKVGDATITITYSSPSVKGRQIWGGLVPYDKVWRAGANQATIIETDKDIKVEGKALPAGKYSLYAIPGEKKWTIIINSATGQWGIKRGGETTEDPAKDVLRVDVKPEKAPAMTESLTYTVDSKGINLIWENVKVPVSVK